MRSPAHERLCPQRRRRARSRSYLGLHCRGHPRHQGSPMNARALRVFSALRTTGPHALDRYETGRRRKPVVSYKKKRWVMQSPERNRHRQPRRWALVYTSTSRKMGFRSGGRDEASRVFLRALQEHLCILADAGRSHGVYPSARLVSNRHGKTGMGVVRLDTGQRRYDKNHLEALCARRAAETIPRPAEPGDSVRRFSRRRDEARTTKLKPSIRPAAVAV